MTLTTATNQGYDAVAMTQEERWTTVRFLVSRSRRSKRASVWWDELGYQPRPGGPIPQPGKWVQHPKARKTGPMPLCLSLDTLQEWLGCKRAVVKSWPWRGGGTPKGTESHVTSYVTTCWGPTRGTEGKQGHAQPNKKNKNKKATQDDKKTTIKKGVP